MATYLVYRCHYNNPSEKKLVKFEADDTLLDWFANRWQKFQGSEPANELEREIGFDVYGLWSIFERALENNLDPPTGYAQLKAYLDEHLYTEGGVELEPHFVQVGTDDDEIEVAYYLFDDEFLKKDGERVAFLMHDDWKLPTTYKPKGNFQPNERVEMAQLFGGKGNTYFARSEIVDSINFDPVWPVCFHGVRLPDWPKLLFSVEPSEAWPAEIRLLRSAFFFGRNELDGPERLLVDEIYREPENANNWDVYSDWLQDHGREALHITFLNRAFETAILVEPEMIPLDFGLSAWPEPEVELAKLIDASEPRVGKSKMAVSEHLAQACPFYTSFEYPNRKYEIHHQWWLFDDCWAKKNQDLANGLMKFCCGWEI